jgi:replicative DNA helicase
LSDLRESGAIEQHADKVIFIHRPEYYGFMEDEEGNSLAGVVDIIVAKNAYGPLGDVAMHRTPKFTNIVDGDVPAPDFSFGDRLKELGLEDSFNKLVDTFNLEQESPF